VTRARGGFTITEVMVAIVVLSVGILALLGGAAGSRRMLSQGERTTWAAAVASARLETLRRAANRTVPRCGDASFKSGSATTDGVTEKWVVQTVGSYATVFAIVTYRKYNGTATDTVATVIGCES
jgi:prepilin-type N-terminal cleavage/methylation domain-containing protein